MDSVSRLLVGAVDLHMHSGPSPMPRRVDHVEAARLASAAGFRAIVVKDHYHSTVFDVLAMESQLAGLKTQVFGGIALNSQVGGLNAHAVDLALRMGGRMVWFPTISAKAHIDHAVQDEVVRQHFLPKGVMQSEEIDIFGVDGELRPEVHQIIGIAKEHRALISAGHLGAASTIALFEAAAAVGATQMIVSHPNFIINADKKQVVELTKLGVVIEHAIAMYGDGKRFPFSDLLQWIELLGPEHTSLASDLGQLTNPLPVDVYRIVCGQLLDSGVSEGDLRMMLSTNPARLIALDD